MSGVRTADLHVQAFTSVVFFKIGLYMYGIYIPVYDDVF